MNYDKLELPAGEDQLIVLYMSRDTSSMIDVGTLTNEVANDAAARSKDGWQLNSLASLPMRQMGTSGNVLFQSGGQYVTKATLIAVYTRKPG
ncbi:MAG: hypothetical protein ABI797_00840 [Chloroflexota bacterium]